MRLSFRFVKHLALVVSLGFGSPSALAEYNAGKLGEAAGAYMMAIDMMEKLQHSRCGYMFEKKTYRFDDAVKEVMQYLRPKDKKELQVFLDGEENRKERHDNTRYIENWLRSIAREGRDEKKTCVLFVGNIATIYNSATTKWEYAKQNYAK
jgi:hypothetical protein